MCWDKCVIRIFIPIIISISPPSILTDDCNLFWQLILLPIHTPSKERKYVINPISNADVYMLTSKRENVTPVARASTLVAMDNVISILILSIDNDLLDFSLDSTIKPIPIADNKRKEIQWSTGSIIIFNDEPNVQPKTVMPQWKIPKDIPVFRALIRWLLHERPIDIETAKVSRARLNAIKTMYWSDNIKHPFRKI